MDSGSLRYHMEILKRTPRAAESRAAENDWTVFATVRARIVAVSTTERAALGGKQATATHTVTCRFVEGVDNTMRLRLPASGRVFEVTDIRTDATGRRRLTIKATEREVIPR